jgi:hypothetical protein
MLKHILIMALLVGALIGAAHAGDLMRDGHHLGAAMSHGDGGHHAHGHGTHRSDHEPDRDHDHSSCCLHAHVHCCAAPLILSTYLQGAPSTKALPWHRREGAVPLGQIGQPPDRPPRASV